MQLSAVGQPERLTRNRVVKLFSRFISLMNEFMPKWKFYKDELNRLPVRHEDWNY